MAQLSIEPGSTFAYYYLVPRSGIQNTYGWQSERRLSVRFRVDTDFKLTMLALNSRLSRFARKDDFGRALLAPAADGESHENGPGLAKLYDYENWYKNDYFFAMHRDAASDAARIFLHPQDDPVDLVLTEFLTFGDPESPSEAAFEWAHDGLVGIRFQSASRAIPPSALADSISSCSTDWPK